MANPTPDGPRVVLETSAGDITVGLFEKRAPRSTENFLHYVRTGFYEGLIFHRVVKGFVIQGGGVEPNGRERKRTRDPIRLEVTPDLKHENGALAMARTQDPHSATSQFYICHGAQPSLDGNYAVFGQVVDGMDVVERIATTPTGRGDQPKQDVVIKRAHVQGGPR